MLLLSIVLFVVALVVGLLIGLCLSNLWEDSEYLGPAAIFFGPILMGAVAGIYVLQAWILQIPAWNHWYWAATAGLISGILVASGFHVFLMELDIQPSDDDE